MGCWMGTKKFITIIWGGASPLSRPHPLPRIITDTTDRYGLVVTVGGVGGVGGDFSHTGLKCWLLVLFLLYLTVFH